MIAVITKVGELQANLTQTIEFDVQKNNGEVLTSMTLTCMPSEAELTINRMLSNFNDEYEKSLELKVGTEING